MDTVTQHAGDDGDTRPPTMAEIGRALGLSRQAVSKAAKEGMPTHSVEAAFQWRDSHLDPARRKSGGPYAAQREREKLRARAAQLLALSADALRVGGDAFRATAHLTQAAISRITPDELAALSPPPEVMDALRSLFPGDGVPAMPHALPGAAFWGEADGTDDGEDSPANHWRKARLKAQVELLEMEVRERKARLCTRETVETVISESMRVIRERSNRLVTELAPRLAAAPDESRVHAIMAEEIERALTDMSNAFGELAAADAANAA